MANSQKKLKGRATRVRSALKRASRGRARLSVFRSGKHIYAQVIDDVKGETLASASSIEESARKDVPKGSGMPAAAYVGKLIAERSLKKGVAEVMFDRGPYIFHGRVKALADAAREAGLNF